MKRSFIGKLKQNVAEIAAPFVDLSPHSEEAIREVKRLQRNVGLAHQRGMKSVPPYLARSEHVLGEAISPSEPIKVVTPAYWRAAKWKYYPGEKRLRNVIAHEVAHQRLEALYDPLRIGHKPPFKSMRNNTVRIMKRSGIWKTMRKLGYALPLKTPLYATSDAEAALKSALRGNLASSVPITPALKSELKGDLAFGVPTATALKLEALSKLGPHKSRFRTILSAPSRLQSAEGRIFSTRRRLASKLGNPLIPLAEQQRASTRLPLLKKRLKRVQIRASRTPTGLPRYGLVAAIADAHMRGVDIPDRRARQLLGIPFYARVRPIRYAARKPPPSPLVEELGALRAAIKKRELTPESLRGRRRRTFFKDRLTGELWSRPGTLTHQDLGLQLAKTHNLTARESLRGRASKRNVVLWDLGMLFPGSGPKPLTRFDVKDTIDALRRQGYVAKKRVRAHVFPKTPTFARGLYAMSNQYAPENIRSLEGEMRQHKRPRRTRLQWHSRIFGGRGGLSSEELFRISQGKRSKTPVYIYPYVKTAPPEVNRILEETYRRHRKILAPQVATGRLTERESKKRAGIAAWQAVKRAGYKKVKKPMDVWEKQNYAFGRLKRWWKNIGTSPILEHQARLANRIARHPKVPRHIRKAAIKEAEELKKVTAVQARQARNLIVGAGVLPPIATMIGGAVLSRAMAPRQKEQYATLEQAKAVGEQIRRSVLRRGRVPNVVSIPVRGGYRRVRLTHRGEGIRAPAGLDPRKMLDIPAVQTEISELAVGALKQADLGVAKPTRRMIRFKRKPVWGKRALIAGGGVAAGSRLARGEEEPEPYAAPTHLTTWLKTHPKLLLSAAAGYLTTAELRKLWREHEQKRAQQHYGITGQFVNAVKKGYTVRRGKPMPVVERLGKAVGRFPHEVLSTSKRLAVGIPAGIAVGGASMGLGWLLAKLLEGGTKHWPNAPIVRADVEGLEPYYLRLVRQQVYRICDEGTDQELHYAAEATTSFLSRARNAFLRHGVSFLAGMILAELLGRGIGRKKESHILEHVRRPQQRIDRIVTGTEPEQFAMTRADMERAAAVARAENLAHFDELRRQRRRRPSRSGVHKVTSEQLARQHAMATQNPGLLRPSVRRPTRLRTAIAVGTPVVLLSGGLGYLGLRRKKVRSWAEQLARGEEPQQYFIGQAAGWLGKTLTGAGAKVWGPKISRWGLRQMAAEKRAAGYVTAAQRKQWNIPRGWNQERARAWATRMGRMSPPEPKLSLWGKTKKVMKEHKEIPLYAGIMVAPSLLPQPTQTVRHVYDEE